MVRSGAGASGLLLRAYPHPCWHLYGAASDDDDASAPLGPLLLSSDAEQGPDPKEMAKALNAYRWTEPHMCSPSGSPSSVDASMNDASMGRVVRMHDCMRRVTIICLMPFALTHIHP